MSHQNKNKKQLIDELKELSNESTALFEDSPNSIYIIDDNGVIISCNKMSENIGGYGKEDIAGRHFRKLKTGLRKENKKLLKRFKEALAGKKILPFELAWKFKSRSIHYSIFRISTIGDHNKIIGIQAVATDITEQKIARDELEKSYKKIKKILRETINALASVVGIKDPYTSGHQRLITEIAIEISKKLKLSESRIKSIEVASSIHDIGKINIPDSILSKPGKLSDIEYDIMKTHSKSSYKMIKKISFPWPVAEIVLQHHEREDGSGYPNNLKSKDIMIEAKILAVADAVGAMLSHRPYRPARSMKEIIIDLRKNETKLYDKKVVGACIEVLKEKKY
jgi:PAS domain S-box-containing protein